MGAINHQDHRIDASLCSGIIGLRSTGFERPRRHGDVGRLPARADVTAPDDAVLDEPAGDVFGRVDGNGKAKPLRRQNHSGVHADDFAARIDERPAGIARIQRRVGLDDVVHEPARSGPERPAQRAHYARRHRVLEPVRIADGDGKLAHA